MKNTSTIFAIVQLSFLLGSPNTVSAESSNAFTGKRPAFATRSSTSKFQDNKELFSIMKRVSTDMNGEEENDDGDSRFAMQYENEFEFMRRAESSYLLRSWRDPTEQPLDMVIAASATKQEPSSHYTYHV